MSAYDYDRAASSVRRMLERFGRDVILRKSRPAAYDPATSTVAVGTQHFTATGVLLSYAQSEVDGTLIRQGDQRLLMAVEPLLRPETGDNVVIDLQVFTVIDVRATEPAGVAVLYELQLRGVVLQPSAPVVVA